MNWGLFERIDGGERFIVISTHWDINTADEPKNRLRLIQAGEMAELIAEHTGQTFEQITRDSDRDRWFTAEQAKDYGLVDHVISHAEGPISN